MPARDKHSSLLVVFILDEEIEFENIGLRRKANSKRKPEMATFLDPEGSRIREQEAPWFQFYKTFSSLVTDDAMKYVFGAVLILASKAINWDTVTCSTRVCSILNRIY
jgi:hypothetical protein